MFEGAQGTFLDIDHGTFPYVTSSNTLAGNACCGAGIGPLEIDMVLGVVKAYTTRVGEGPFPTELKDELGERLRNGGIEFGSTTGRPRRCGWLDLVLVKTAIRLNSIKALALTKLDVLSGFEKLKICIAYEYEGKTIDYLPTSLIEMAKLKPIYKELPGWKKDIKNVKKFEDLPNETKNYIKTIEEYLGIPFYLISTGPERENCFILKNPFEN